MSFYTINNYTINVRECSLHKPRRSGPFENYKQHTADLKSVALFPYLKQLSFNFQAHKYRLDGGVYF